MLENKIGMIFGVANKRSIAWACAEACAAQGARLAFTYQGECLKENVEKLTANMPGTVVVPCDVTSQTEVEAAFNTVKKEFGRLDVLINNAGTTVDIEPRNFDAMTMEAWNRVFDVNVLGLFLVTRAAVPLLKKSAGACIVNTCSIAGLRPGAQPLPYAASKAAVANLTKTLAHALGPEIRVNAVAPGWIEGDWMKRTLAQNYEGLMARRAKYTPLKRCCTEDDVADSMLGLILHNRFVTGEIIVVDGGFSSTT